MKRERGPRHVDLDVDQIFKARLEDIIRLARFLGAKIDSYLDKPDAKWRIACAIVRWNKKNPQKKCKT